MSKDPEQFEKEREQRKEVRRRKRKKEHKQLETLNNISQGKWRKIGAIAAWIGYRVSVEGEEEIVPVRRGASRMELSTINQNLKRYIRRKHQLQAERKKKQNQKRRQARKI